MSEMTLAEMQAEIVALRREISETRVVSPAPAPPDTIEQLRQQLQEKGKQNGMSVGFRTSQFRENGSSGTASSSNTLHDATDLPSDEKIAEKIARLAVLIQTPLALRALRCLAEPHFEGRDKRRSKSDLAASLGVGEAEIEAVMALLLDNYEVTWGKDKTGQEYYEWTGNSFAMLVLIHG